jgi:hypothetical protein
MEFTKQGVLNLNSIQVIASKTRQVRGESNMEFTKQIVSSKTRQGVRNLDSIKVEKVLGKDIPYCDGKTTCTISKWKKEGIYPNAAFEHVDDPEPAWRAGTVEVRRCLCCSRWMEERNRVLDFETSACK